MANQSKRNNFIKQAGILAIAGILCRIIGILYKSPLIALIGEEGIGYYNFAGNVYTIMLLVSSYSIPSAVSKEIAKKLIIQEYRNAQRIFYCSLIYVIIIGGAASAFALFGAGLFVERNSVAVLRVLAPTIFLSGLLGVLRGYFQAQSNMVHSSVSQILEQIFNAVVSVLGAYLLMQTVAGTDSTTQAIYGAVGSAIGTGAGVLSALIFMLFVYFLNRRTRKKHLQESSEKLPEPYKKIFQSIFNNITPFIISTCIYNATSILNQTVYSKILLYAKNFPVKKIASEYGIYSGEAVIFVNIPVAIASAVSSAMMPDISGTYSLGNVKETRRKVDMAIRTTMLITIPSAVGLFILAGPVVQALFSQRSSLAEAAALLRCLSITAVFYSLSTVTNAVLQGIGKMNHTAKNALLALFSQSAVLTVILFQTGWNLYGLVIAAVVHSFLMCVLNGISVRKNLGYQLNIKKSFVIPLTAAAIMGVVASFSYQMIHTACGSNIISLFLTITLSAVIYFIIVIKLGGISENELLALPQGNLLTAVAKRAKVL